MTLDTTNITFWVIGAIWFSVPILSWLWSLASVYYYKKIMNMIKEANDVLEQTRQLSEHTKNLNEHMLKHRLETLEIKNKAEEEIKLACKYYARVAELVEKNNEDSN